MGVILLGGPFELETMASRHETVYNLAAGRLIEFIEFTKAHPNLKRVFSGGGPIHPVLDGKPMGEAEIAKRVFERMGYDDRGMIFEGSSKNTIENAWKTKEIIQPKPGEKWVLMDKIFSL